VRSEDHSVHVRTITLNHAQFSAGHAFARTHLPSSEHKPTIARFLLVREIQPFCRKNASSSTLSIFTVQGAVTAVGGSYLFLELRSADQNDNYDGFAVGAKAGRKKRKRGVYVVLNLVWTSEPGTTLSGSTWSEQEPLNHFGNRKKRIT
jgi:hypothetical protein